MRHDEDALQMQIVAWLNYNDAFFWHVPNGGRRNKREAARLKRMGVLPGVADLAFIVEGRPAFIELKVDRGKQSKDQLIFEARVVERGGLYRIVRSFDEALDVIDEWGIASKPRSIVRI